MQWTPVNYFLEDQTEPIELCPPVIEPCDFECPTEDEAYKLPIKIGDTVKWIINKNQITVDGGSNVDSLKIALAKEGILVAENIGYLEDKGGSQYYCTATIPIGIDCFKDGCDYQFVIYDDTISPNVNCGIFECATLQDVIDEDVSLGEILECELVDFLCSDEGFAETSGKVFFVGSIGSELTNDPEFLGLGPWYTLGGASFTVSSGVVNFDTNPDLTGKLLGTNSTILATSKTYIVRIVVSSFGSGFANVSHNTNIGTINGVGVYEFRFTKSFGSFFGVEITGYTSTGMVISEFSVREISGVPDVYFSYNPGDIVPVRLADDTLLDIEMDGKGVDGTSPYFLFTPAIVGTNQNVIVYY